MPRHLDGIDPIQLFSSDDSVFVEGSGAVNLRTGGGAFIPSGPNAGERILAALAGGATELRLSGVYELNETLIITPDQVSDVSRFGAPTLIFDGSPSTVFVPSATFTPSPLLADDGDNALIRIEGVLDPTFSTLITTAALPSESELVTFDSIVGLDPDDWLALEGHIDPANDMSGMNMGDFLTAREITQVKTPAAATVLYSPTVQWHSRTNGGVGTPSTVTRVRPMLDVVVSGIGFYAAGGTIAVGLSLGYAAKLTLQDLWFQGFSRYGLELRRGARDHQLRHIRGKGELNALIGSRSSMCGVWTDIVSDGSNTRRDHVLGVPVGQLSFYDRSMHIAVGDFKLEHAVVGVRTWGGMGLSFSHGLIRDMNAEASFVRDPTIPSRQQGVGVDMGTTTLGWNEFGMKQSFQDVHLESCFVETADPLTSGWYYHDQYSPSIGNCSISNFGQTPLAAGRNCYGMFVQDLVGGELFDFSWRGVQNMLQLHGAQISIDVGAISFEGTSGAGLSGDIGIWFNMVAQAYPRFRGPVTASNVVNPIVFDPVNYAAFPDYTISIPSYLNKNYGRIENADAVVFLNSSAALLNPGDVVEIDPASAPNGTRAAIATTGPTQFGAVVLTVTGVGGWGLMAMLPNRHAMVNVTGVGNAGDILEANAANQLVVNNAAAPRTAAGRLLQDKAAAAVELVLVGSVD